jgi:hypothetical protein
MPVQEPLVQTVQAESEELEGLDELATVTEAPLVPEPVRKAWLRTSQAICGNNEPDGNGEVRLHRDGDNIVFSIPAHRLLNMGPERIEAVLPPDRSHIFVEHFVEVPIRGNEQQLAKREKGWVAVWRCAGFLCAAWRQPDIRKGMSAWIEEAKVRAEDTPRPTISNTHRAEELHPLPEGLVIPHED